MIEPLVAMPAACGPRGMAPLRKRFTNEQDLAQAIEPFVVAASYLPAVKSITSKYVAQQKFLVQELYKLHANLAFKQSMLVKIHAKFFDDHRTTWQLPAGDRDAWSTTMALRLRCVCRFVAQAMRKKTQAAWVSQVLNLGEEQAVSQRGHTGVEMQAEETQTLLDSHGEEEGEEEDDVTNEKPEAS